MTSHRNVNAPAESVEFHLTDDPELLLLHPHLCR
jgi:hypothetical protein